MKKLKYLLLFIASGTLTAIYFPAQAVHTEVNGCGSGPTRSITPNGFLANFEPACNEHDLCYGILGQTRESCDNRFRRNMRQRCSSTYDDWWERPSRRICYENAELYYEAVRRLGGDAYREAQDHARQAQ